jgi:hypothetical protein
MRAYKASMLGERSRIVMLAKVEARYGSFSRRHINDSVSLILFSWPAMPINLQARIADVCRRFTFGLKASVTKEVR